jgi:hypothetical protein
MNPLDTRKRLKAFAEQMKEGCAPSDEQYRYLHWAFEKIAAGEDANKVLGVAFSRGKKKSDAEARQKMSFVLHWVACAVEPRDGDLPGQGYTHEKAFEEAAILARQIFGVSETDKYDAQYIKKCWYAKDKQHMQSPVRQSFEPDSPF